MFYEMLEIMKLLLLYIKLKLPVGGIQFYKKINFIPEKVN